MRSRTHWRYVGRARSEKPPRASLRKRTRPAVRAAFKFTGTLRGPSLVARQVRRSHPGALSDNGPAATKSHAILAHYPLPASNPRERSLAPPRFPTSAPDMWTLVPNTRSPEIRPTPTQNSAEGTDSQASPICCGTCGSRPRHLPSRTQIISGFAFGLFPAKFHGLSFRAPCRADFSAYFRNCVFRRILPIRDPRPLPEFGLIFRYPLVLISATVR